MQGVVMNGTQESSDYTASQQPLSHLHASPHLHCPLPGPVPREKKEDEL